MVGVNAASHSDRKNGPSERGVQTGPDISGLYPIDLIARIKRQVPKAPTLHKLDTNCPPQFVLARKVQLATRYSIVGISSPIIKRPESLEYHSWRRT
jgi:hypothetical protein